MRKTEAAMSWVRRPNLNFFEQFFVNVIKCGPVPNHVAFIMDGNRRYAKKAKLDDKYAHCCILTQLINTIQWCFELGITEITMFALHIDSFKRSNEEVETFLKLLTEKFQKLLSEKGKRRAEGLCIRVFGNFALIPEELRKHMAQVMLMTKDNNKFYLNIAFAYTFRDEIVNTTKDIVGCVKKGLINVEDINEDVITDCLYTNCSNPPDIIVRTSGEIKLSDFLLWQIGTSTIYFSKILWPEFSIWHLLAVVFKYQTSYLEIKRYKKTKRDKYDVEEFFKKVELDRLSQIRDYIN